MAHLLRIGLESVHHVGEIAQLAAGLLGKPFVQLLHRHPERELRRAVGERRLQRLSRNEPSCDAEQPAAQTTGPHLAPELRVHVASPLQHDERAESRADTCEHRQRDDAQDPGTAVLDVRHDHREDAPECDDQRRPGDPAQHALERRWPVALAVGALLADALDLGLERDAQVAVPEAGLEQSALL